MPEYKLPSLGESLQQAEVVRVEVKAGDSVSSGDVLLALETEKAVMDVPSPFDGKIDTVLVKEGDQVKSGQAVLSYSDNQGQSEGKGGQQPEQKPEERPEAQSQIESEQKSEKQPEQNSPDQPEESGENPENKSKEKPNEEAGLKPEQIARPQAEQRPEPQDEKNPQKPKSEKPDQANSSLVQASPSTRKLARELGVDLAQVAGSGPAGRISDDDLKQFVRGLLETGQSKAPAAVPALPDFSRWGKVRVEPLKGVMRAMADSMARARDQVAPVTQHDEADITALESARVRWAETRGKDKTKISMTALAARACAIALGEFPLFNASLDASGAKIIYKDYFHLGIAVDSPQGLLVPVLRDAGKKDVLQLAREIADLAARARDRKLKADDMAGASFTISNLGGIGGTAFTPVVYWPNAAILGISQARRSLQSVQGRFEEKILLPLSLSYDHRLIDGASAARFARRLCLLLGNPFELSLWDKNE
jgi:pyruvate dehydrogenase E2 component (dihydrolipoamide acetyltransferase)